MGLQISLIERDKLYSQLRSQPFSFFGVVSFEKRCTTSAQNLVSNGLVPTEACFLSYKTRAFPEEINSFSMEANKRDFFRILENSCKLETPDPLNPYSINILRYQMDKLLSECSSSFYLIDISCMTRIHLFAIALLVATNKIDYSKVAFCYTCPQSYSLHKRGSIGWRDTVLVPIGKNRTFRREGHARGLVMAGHDSERLSIALSELEPASGLLIFAETPRRPDFLQRARESNRTISKRLLTLRMPRPFSSKETVSFDQWSEKFVELTSFGQFYSLIDPEIQAAINDEGPIILFPFGPKSLTLASGILLATTNNLNAWAVYPIPEGYPANYSTGSAMIHWMGVTTWNSK